MDKRTKLVELHFRLVRRYAAKGGARLSPSELALLVEDARLLDHLWTAVADTLVADADEGKGRSGNVATRGKGRSSEDKGLSQNKVTRRQIFDSM